MASATRRKWPRAGGAAQKRAVGARTRASNIFSTHTNTHRHTRAPQVAKQQRPTVAQLGHSLLLLPDLSSAPSSALSSGQAELRASSNSHWTSWRKKKVGQLVAQPASWPADKTAEAKATANGPLNWPAAAQANGALHGSLPTCNGKPANAKITTRFELASLCAASLCAASLSCASLCSMSLCVRRAPATGQRLGLLFALSWRKCRPQFQVFQRPVSQFQIPAFRLFELGPLDLRLWTVDCRL